MFESDSFVACAMDDEDRTVDSFYSVDVLQFVERNLDVEHHSTYGHERALEDDTCYGIMLCQPTCRA